MKTQYTENTLIKKYGNAFSTIAKFAGLNVRDVISEFENRICSDRD